MQWKILENKKKIKYEILSMDVLDFLLRLKLNEDSPVKQDLKEWFFNIYCHDIKKNK